MPTTILTDLAEAKIAAAAGTEEAVAITEIALGDSNGASYAGDFAQTGLVNELARLPIETRTQISATAWRVKVAFPAETAAFQVREAGFFDADGDLIALATFPDAEVRQTGAIVFLIDHVLDFSRAEEGLVVVEAPDDELLEHAILDLEAHAILANEQYELTVAQREAEAALAARDAAAAAIAPVGMVAPFARAASPQGWLPCDGRAVSRADYADLFAAVGVAFGDGDGATTFNLPDLRGEFVRCCDRLRGVDSGRSFGSAQGDAIRNLEGHLSEFLYQGDGVDPEIIGQSGVFQQETDGTIMKTADVKVDVAGGATRDKITFDASRVVPTADENRPRNIALNYCIRF